MCVEPLDLIEIYPEYVEICSTDYCFGTVAGLKYFADEIGAYINNVDDEILIEMLSIHNQNKPHLEIILTPNPVLDFLNIQTDESISTIVIYNAQGKVVFKQNSDTRRINVSSLSRGVYFIAIGTEEGKQGNQKFIKQ